MKILVLIPARGGSKSIPRKNVKLLHGKSMIAYCIESAKSIEEIDRVIVSTDDSEIADIARSYGAEVPFIRPAELATDEVATLPVIQHALEWLKQHEAYEPDYVLLLYPTSPLLPVQRIREAIELAQSKQPDSIISCTQDFGHYWHEVKGVKERFYPKEIVNRQWVVPLYKENGAIYMSKSGVFKQHLVADQAEILLMEPEENVDVDTPQDWEKAEEILRNRQHI